MDDIKKIKISLDDLLVVLDAMKENGTRDIYFFSYNDYPAICDSDDPESVITFQSVNETGEVNEDEEIIH